MAGIKPGWPPERHAATPSFATHTNAFINKLGWREKKHINKNMMEDNKTSREDMIKSGKPDR